MRKLLIIVMSAAAIGQVVCACDAYRRDSFAEAAYFQASAALLATLISSLTNARRAGK